MIIVTGGAGFIGSALVWRLNQLGTDDILIVDHLDCNEKWMNLAPLRFKDYIEKDDFLVSINSKRASAIAGPAKGTIEAVVHLGACSLTTERDASFLIKNNFAYTKQLALFALTRNIRFIYASSAATYGDGNNGFKDDETKLNELRALNVYGYSKQLFDVWAKSNGLLDKMAGLKYFNVYGPNEYHKEEMRSLIVKAYEQILSTGRIKLFRSHCADYADGEQMRDFLYIKDAVDMTVHFLTNRRANGIYNIGSGKTKTWNALASAIFKALGKPSQIEYIDMPRNIREKYQYYTCADIEKIRNIGYDKPETPFAAAIEDYVKNYLVDNKRLGE